MSKIIDDLDTKLAKRLSEERRTHDWSLSEVAARSGVSKAMLSRVERAEVSPSAALLARVAAAFGQTLAQFLSFEGEQAKRLVRAADLPVRQDPQSDYLRRQIFIDADSAFELVEVELPSGAAVPFPASIYLHSQNVVWMLSGELTLREGDDEYVLVAGDRFAFGPPADVIYQNTSEFPCRYVVAVAKR